MAKHWFKYSLLCLVAMLSSWQLLASGPDSDLAAFKCQSPRVTFHGMPLVIRCKITSHRPSGGPGIYLLADQFALEGPLDEASVYLNMPAGMERFENVLRYNKSSKGTLDLPTLFHPTVHLTFEKLKKLVLLQGGRRMDVDVIWKLPAGALYPDRGKWLVQAKLVYLTQERASQLIRASDLPKECRTNLNRAILSVRPKNKISVEAIRRRDEILWTYDGCEDVISEKFQHLYSNTMVISVEERSK